MGDRRWREARRAKERAEKRLRERYAGLDVAGRYSLCKEALPG